MPALNHRFKSSWDYRVPASGRFARGTVLGGDTNRIIHASIAKFLATRYPPEGREFIGINHQVECGRYRSRFCNETTS